MACVYHELARVAGGNGDGKRVPYVLIRNGEPNAADRLVFAHILAVDRRDHRIMQHALNVHRNRRGGLVRAVRNSIGKRRVVVLANRGRIGKLLRRFVKRQRAQQSGCSMAGNMQHVAVHVVVVVQHAKGMRTGVEHIYLVVLANRRVRRRIDGQRNGIAALRLAVADGQRNGHRSVCVRLRQNAQRARAVAVVRNGNVVRRDQSGVRAARN